MKISACYIVKNEEENLEKSICSIKDFYDELIVVDTGSTDNTVQIAQKYNAKIFFYSWHNDFAAARNFGKKKARGDWIIYLDADECYNGSVSLRDFFRKKELSSIDAILVASYYSQEFPPARALKFFRNDDKLEYKGKVHEVLTRKDGELRWIYIPKLSILHRGYEKEILPQKIRRNMNIILEDIRENGENEAYYFYLARGYFFLHDYNKSLYYIKKAITSPITYYNEEMNYYHILLESMRQLKYPPQEMIEVADEGIRQFPELPEFYGEKGIILSSIGDYDNAYELLKKCIYKYEFPEKSNRAAGYLDNNAMGIIYARLARLAMIKNEEIIPELATILALKTSNGVWGKDEREIIIANNRYDICNSSDRKI